MMNVGISYNEEEILIEIILKKLERSSILERHLFNSLVISKKG